MTVKTLNLALFLLFLSACGEAPRASDPTFTPFLQSFIAYAQQYGWDTAGWERISITFNPNLNQKDEEVVGLCHWWEGLAGEDIPDTDYVEILTEFWTDASEVEKETLIFHELGHCLLQREHIEETHPITAPWHVSCPDSLMYPYLVWEEVYATYRNEFITELFTFDRSDLWADAK